jgi:hypothetical protein
VETERDISLETSQINEQIEPLLADEVEAQDDGRGTLALAAGMVAAAVGGGIWAVVILLTKMEIGWVAWGIGALVGIAMSRVTRKRTQQLAYAAAGYAVFGLLIGKAFSLSASVGIIARQVEADTTVMTSAVAWQMYQARELSQPTLEAIDAAAGSGSELGDAITTDMHQQAAAKIAQMSLQQKHEAAVRATNASLKDAGLVEIIRSQLSFFDLLWVFLAVATAYRMMAPVRHRRLAHVS